MLYDSNMSKQQRDSKKRVALVQLFAERSSSAELPSEIHVIPTGDWAHPIYGLAITAADISQFKQNLDAGVRRDIPITAGHDNGMSGGELPCATSSPADQAKSIYRPICSQFVPLYQSNQINHRWFPKIVN
jgi:hypothetical protein